VEYYYYDQLGSGFSDQPAEPSLWEPDRFVDEVEQVRQALGLNRDNFVLYGHSWGGILAIEYALRHPQHLRGLVISNMMSSVPAYNDYAERVLMPEMDQAVLAEIKSLEAKGDTENPRYMELLTEQHYIHHVLRMPPETGRTRFSAASPIPTRRSTSRCRAPASSASARTPRSRTGTVPPSSRRSTYLPWSSALATTPWTRTIWR
jgi:proline-specific peptidase